jgi:rhamnose utilization protein RhaD (predicted bifunctional aldolase and dehydrogenase)
MSLEQLVELSREYGSDPRWVLAGGGNTSYKDDSTLSIKASGFPLGSIGPEGFARMRRAELAKTWEASYPQDPAEREAATLADLMAAREEGEEKRPSVETLMHDLFPYPYVIHTHPSLVNGLTCAQDGEAAARRLFGERLLWVPAIEPGYILALEMRRLATRYAEAQGEFPRLVMLQNHGLVVTGESAEEIRALHRDVERTIRGALVREPDPSAVDADEAARDRWLAAIETAWHGEVAVEFAANAELARRVESREAFEPLAGAFTPDHIVYAGSAPIYLPGTPANAAAGLRSQITSYTSEHGSEPRIFAVEGLGAFAVAETPKAAATAMALFTDELAIAAYAESFGGARPLDEHLVRFIESWEVERYRKTISGGA